MKKQELHDKINSAAQAIGKTWPLYSFVTANPLSGYEDAHFLEAVEQAGNLWDAQVLPAAKIFRQAWEEGRIDPDEIQKILRENGKTESPEHSLEAMETELPEEHLNPQHELDRLTVKWVALFMDEGLAAWPMPFKEMGFYTAWRKLIVYDEDINEHFTVKIPIQPEEALSQVLEEFEEEDRQKILERHLAALPGWAGFIKYRMENNSIWNQEYPIDLLQYLAVRLWMASCIGAPLIPDEKYKKDPDLLALKYCWLEAWERTWQKRFFKKLKRNSKTTPEKSKAVPDVQLVFCLDSRSEVLRRLLEARGNYETFGSAGSFGILMDYQNPESGLINKASPAMVPSQFIVHEEPSPKYHKEAKKYREEGKRLGTYAYFLKRMKNILPSAFGFVEGSGFYYGFFMLLRIFNPVKADRLMLRHQEGLEKIYDAHISPIGQEEGEYDDIPLSTQVGLVKAAFDSCGWRTFAPLVVFTGHASHSANNPFYSSLDCGACAGNPGKRNARALARLANSKAVRKELREKHDIQIPGNTLFMAGEHITSTDHVELFDTEVPESHRETLHRLRQDLLEVKKSMTRERLNEPKKAVSWARRKAYSWSESRPEWGLSGHAGYIIGPRSLSRNDEYSDCFLSSYDWEIDSDGSILKGIMQGPLLVCQWISNHYYFSTVDNEVFGGGSKITLNITGKYGVVQGNGSDLKMGLPLQSLMSTDDKVYHYPLRLSTLIQAPKRYITEILESDDKLRSLLDNGWIHLFVMDPEKNNQIERY